MNPFPNVVFVLFLAIFTITVLTQNVMNYFLPVSRVPRNNGVVVAILAKIRGKIEYLKSLKNQSHFENYAIMKKELLLTHHNLQDLVFLGVILVQLHEVR